MIDLGFVHMPLEALNVIVILTAILLAARYIGFDIVAAIAGITAVIYGLKVALFEKYIILGGHTLGVYEGWLLVIVGGFLVYRGSLSFFEEDEVNSWK